MLCTVGVEAVGESLFEDVPLCNERYPMKSPKSSNLRHGDGVKKYNLNKKYMFDYDGCSFASKIALQPII